MLLFFLFFLFLFIEVSCGFLAAMPALRRIASLVQCNSDSPHDFKKVRGADKAQGVKIMEIKTIQLNEIRTNPNNIYEEQNIIELADSIKNWGQLENATAYLDIQNDGKNIH